VSGDYIDPETGIRFVEDTRGNYHCIHPMAGGTMGDITINIPEIKIPEIPPAEVHVDVTPPVDDPEKQRLIRIMEALRSENNWLWSVITTAIIDRKKSGGAPKAMDELEQKIKDRQRA
jgi:hypothetical protein